MKFTMLIISVLASIALAAPVVEKRSYSGTATYYNQGGAAGACGNYANDSDYVCALQTSMYAGGAHCGSIVTIKNGLTGKTVKCKVADECPTCESSTSIDMSVGAFFATGGGDGVFPITWWFS